MLLYGSPDPLPEQVPLRAGPLRLVFEQGDLRSVCLGADEILRRVYVAVRDQDWGTVAPRLSDVQIQAGPDSFHIQYQAENRDGAIDFAWRAEIHGGADGTIRFTMDGEARATFSKNRIGFCVLLPAALAGQPAWVEHGGGASEQTTFPVALCADQPVPPFSDLRALRYPPPSGGQEPRARVELRLDGDEFEMEDQRLWTDASYKIYSTPLSLPTPVTIEAGTRIRQSVELRLAGVPGQAQPHSAARPEDEDIIAVELDGEWRPLPALGLSVASHGAALEPGEVQRLRALRLDHLRAEIDPSAPDALDLLRRAAEQSQALEAPLLLALPLRAETAAPALDALAGWLDDLRPRVRGWLVFPAAEPYAGGRPAEEIARAAWQRLKAFDPAAPLAVGTNTDFIFLRRTTLPLEHMDAVTVTLNPQVHAFDNQSLVETLAAQPLIVQNARQMAGGRAVIVSPITLKPRFNPYAQGGKQDAPAPGELPPQVDPRQASLFGAGWTLGSLGAMTAAGAQRVTYYETTGMRGVMAQERGGPAHPRFPAAPGGVYPLYSPLRWAADFAGGEGLALNSPRPLALSALALRSGDRRAVLLANHTAGTLHVAVRGLAGRPGAVFAVTRLDEHTLALAARSSGALDEPSETARLDHDGALRLELRPFALARIAPGDQQEE